MKKTSNKSAFGTGSSYVIDKCQICANPKLESILFLGYLPPVNGFEEIGTVPHEIPSYPANFLYCPNCQLVQLGLVVDPQVIFPKSYPYTSSTTRILRENFTQLYEESTKMLGLSEKDLVIDVGSNDGNLLSNFQGKHKVLGITPEDIGRLAIEKGIPTLLEYFTDETVAKVLKKYGKAKLVTATNVFAHIENPNHVLENIIKLLEKDGVFISESHYLYSLIETLQYDTIYHEHLRYYSLHALKFLMEKHELEIFHARQIPTHGGSIRVYAARKGLQKVLPTVKALLTKEKKTVTSKKDLLKFRDRAELSKLKLNTLFAKIKKQKKIIYGISAPSRATTLINYVGMDEVLIDKILEIKGSYKIGKYIPGTLIPVVEESILYSKQPDYALLLSWHIAKELIPKLREKGFKGKFIIPLPEPKII